MVKTTQATVDPEYIWLRSEGKLMDLEIGFPFKPDRRVRTATHEKKELRATAREERILIDLVYLTTIWCMVSIIVSLLFLPLSSLKLRRGAAPVMIIVVVGGVFMLQRASR